jgi:hypothetical protein
VELVDLFRVILGVSDKLFSAIVGGAESPLASGQLGDPPGKAHAGIAAVGFLPPLAVVFRFRVQLDLLDSFVQERKPTVRALVSGLTGPGNGAAPSLGCGH